MCHALTRQERHEIETMAVMQLEEYYRSFPDLPRTPVPVEHILEMHLGLTLVYLDLKEELEDETVLGALCVERNEVWIDNSLDPELSPQLEGRYRFTVAHEIGHWCLHRFEQLTPDVFAFRSDDRHEIREREADAFAATLLMPAIEVHQQWKLHYGDRQVYLRELVRNGDEILEEVTMRRRYMPRSYDHAHNMMLEWSVALLAQQFRVSSAAMRIRCEQLGLVVR